MTWPRYCFQAASSPLAGAVRTVGAVSASSAFWPQPAARPRESTRATETGARFMALPRLVVIGTSGTLPSGRQGSRDRLGDKTGNIAAQPRHLAHQAGGNEAVLLGRGQERSEERRVGKGGRG